MIVRHFLAWSRGAGAAERAEATAALARALLVSDLADVERAEAEAALVLALDDPSPLVRRAMAEALAHSPRAPRVIIAALAADQGDVAALVLARSPLLGEAELVDHAALGDALTQVAIALRPELPSGVAAALAEVAGPDGLVALVSNASARVPAFSLARIAERHGHHPGVREALIARPDLPVEARRRLIGAVEANLLALVTERGWLGAARAERAGREAREAAVVSLAGGCEARAAELAAGLAAAGELTPALMLRALLAGERALFLAALATAAGAEPARAAHLAREPRGAAFGALLRRAALPAAMIPVVVDAVGGATGGEGARRPGEAPQQGPERARVERAIDALDRAGPGADRAGADALGALLRRLQADAARTDARRLAAALPAPRALTIEHRPAEPPRRAAREAAREPMFAEVPLRAAA